MKSIRLIAASLTCAVLFGCASKPYNSGNIVLSPAPAVIGQINLPK